MADISYNVSAKADKGNLAHSFSASNVTATMNAVGMVSSTYTLSASVTSISTANLGAVGLAFVRNLSTHTLQTCALGVDSSGFVEFSNIRAGEVAVLRLSSGAQYQAKGGVGGRVRVDILEG